MKKFKPLNGGMLDQLTKDYIAGKIVFSVISDYLKETNNAGLIQPLMDHITNVFQIEYELYLQGYDCTVT